MPDTTYLMSFTAGALLYRESLTVAGLFDALQDWNAVRSTVIAENRLQMRTANASRRIYREASARLQTLTPAEMALLQDGTRAEQNQVLWLAICKRYRFIREFAVQVVREKYLRLDFQLVYEDCDLFFADRAEWHPELDDLTSATRKKQRQIIFRMLREAELLSADNRIVAAMLTPWLKTVIGRDDPGHLAIFPISDLELTERTP